MISIFGNAPLHVSAEGTQSLYPTPAQQPAVTRTMVPLSPDPKEAAAPVSRHVEIRAAAPEKRGLFKWLSMGRAKKRLQMLETVSLGEKRFVALVQVDGRQFLIGGAPSNVGMLAELSPEESFHEVIREATQDLSTPVAAITASATPAALADSAQLPATVAAEPLLSAAVLPLPLASPLPLPVVASPEPLASAAISSIPIAAAPSVPPATALPVVATSQSPAETPLPSQTIAPVAELHRGTLSEDALALSMEEPVSFSSSLLAAMKQSAKATLPQAQPQSEPTIAQEFVPQVAPPVQRVLSPAPSFTFQFSPMLHSNSRLARLGEATSKLHGATS